MLSVIVALGVVLGIGCIWWYQNYSRVAKYINQIPGPKGYPILGVFTDYCTNNLEKIFLTDRFRNALYFPIYKIWLFHIPSVLLVHPADIELVLSSTKLNKKSRLYDILHFWLGTGLLTSDGTKWKTRRKLLTPAFHFTILKEFVKIFNDSTSILLQTIENYINTDLDVVPIISEFTLKSIAETSMGIQLDFGKDSNRNYKTAILDFAKVLVHRLSRPWLHNDHIFNLTISGFKSRRIVKTLHDFSKEIIAKRKESSISYSANKRLAMLDLLLKIQQEEGTIDDEGIREEVDTFMFEGHDTTSVAICHILLLLANHSEIQHQIYQEIIDVIGLSEPTYTDLQQLDFTERCIKECLRLFPSVPLIGRDVDEDIKTASGFTIPKGVMVHIFIYDLHRRHEFYPDPETFDPDRFLPENIQKRHPFAYIPFSAGSRNCIGQRFAILEIKSVLCGIIKKFKLEAVDKVEDLKFNSDLVLRSKNPIRVRFLKRIT